jgi:hypothetical protein
MHRKLYFLFLIITITIFSKQAKAQDINQGLRFGAKLPYTYDIGYFNRFSTRFAIHISSQFVTIPFNNVPIGYMNLWGADENITAILDDPFLIGAGIDVGAHYYFGSDNRRYYGGMSIQWMNLLKKDIDDEVINNAFGVDLSSSDYPLGPISKPQSTKPLTLNTNYVNFGIFFGKILPLYNNPDAELRLEIGINKVIFSHHNLQSDYRYITPVTEITNTELQKTMKKYGWFPTINFYFIHKLKS